MKLNRVKIFHICFWAGICNDNILKGENLVQNAHKDNEKMCVYEVFMLEIICIPNTNSLCGLLAEKLTGHFSRNSLSETIKLKNTRLVLR
jgi:hypothetical protein